jgi:hypothetical protein
VRRTASIAWVCAFVLPASTAAAQVPAPPLLPPDEETTTALPRAATEPRKSSPDPGKAAPREGGAPFSFSAPDAWPQVVERVAVSGYLLPQFEIASLPSALPRDQLQYGARGTRAGFALHGTPFEAWSYMLHAVVTPSGTDTLAILSPTSAPSATITLPTATGTSIDVEEATVTYRPAKWFLAKAGVLRIPFSLAQTTPIPKQMFPTRPAETTTFQSGADEGALATLLLFDARLQANVGVFLGSSLGVATPNQTVHGAAFAASIQAHPLGAMSLREGDQSRGPFRFAVGVGSIYRSATSYDATGYQASQFNDLRLAAWVRAQFKGIYLQGEYLRRLQTADLSGRPLVSDGAYGQASYYQPVGGVAFGPLVRVGIVSADEDFASSTFKSFEGGIAFYPRARMDEPEKLRLIAEYIGASVAPLTEVEREGLVQLQLEW